MRKRITKVSCGKVIGDKWEWSTQEMKRQCDNRRKPIVIDTENGEKYIKRNEVFKYKIQGYKPYIKYFE